MHCQRQGPFPAAHNAHTLLLTGEEEAGLSNPSCLSNPSSPSIATGTARITDRSSAGVKVCLTAENHRRLLAKGQDQGRAYGHAPHFFSLTNEKKKNPISDSTVPSYHEFLNHWLLQVPLRGF